MRHYTAAVITVSDKGYRGEREDTSGPALCAILKERGYEVVYTAMVPDEAELIRAELLKCADEKKLSLVLTTGGTGFSPRILHRRPQRLCSNGRRLAFRN